jgi:hypothetical protein
VLRDVPAHQRVGEKVNQPTRRTEGMTDTDSKRVVARRIAREHLEAEDPLGWFEDLYARAEGDSSIIPWADLEPNPNLVAWLDDNRSLVPGPALKIGSGLGDDAEELARRGFTTTAFDISESALAWSRRRFPHSAVTYVVADLLSPPAEWESAFSLVVESYTLQVLPPNVRESAIHRVCSFVAPGGTLLVIARGREPSEPEGAMPWPLIKDELALFESQGLQRVALDEYLDGEEPPVHRFRATYRRPAATTTR